MFDSIAQKIIDQTVNIHGMPVTIRRLDLVHPKISGNKFFKLKYNFLETQRLGYQKLLTFGGAYSNHIAATAFAAHEFGFASVGIIRGEELKNKSFNPTLQTAQDFGMQLHFVSREDYRRKQHPEFLAELQQQFPEHYVIPEGGTNSLAIRGCKEILKPTDAEFDVICCAVGTGGTIAGLIEASQDHQQVLGFSALKGSFLNDDVAKLTSKRNWQIIDDYCCGGYAKTTSELLQFIQDFEAEHGIPLEQVYTGKMLMGLTDLIQKGHFPAGSKILVIHTGGLQGRDPLLDI
ncbi:pyridoxal-phosphate dependent enzyme [Acinetobacter thermotolerans]|uniref:1-aminocyclopropane-1-carboxylate deaminase/D-cysteine desulfhydrase n=1 Tax=Acinetobacter thermotolerans TaxID=3151487 RepID=UPI00325C053E